MITTHIPLTKREVERFIFRLHNDFVSGCDKNKLRDFAIDCQECQVALVIAILADKFEIGWTKASKPKKISKPTKVRFYTKNAEEYAFGKRK